jgi:hypothetical protein
MIIAATMNREQGTAQEILIRNISRRGLGARTHQAPPRLGERVSIRIDTVPEISGAIRWVNGDQFGVLLDRDLDPALFDPRPDDQPRPGIDLFGEGD